MKTATCTLCLTSLGQIASAKFKRGTSAEEKLFLKFCTYFNIKLPLGTLSWDFDKELVPICKDCQVIASSLLKLNDELTNLKTLLRKTEDSVRIKIRESQKLLNQFAIKDQRILALRHLINGPVVLLERTEVLPPYRSTQAGHAADTAEVNLEFTANLDKSEIEVTVPQAQPSWDSDEITQPFLKVEHNWNKIEITEPSPQPELWEDDESSEPFRQPGARLTHNEITETKTNLNHSFRNPLEEDSESIENDLKPALGVIRPTVKLEPAKWDDEDWEPCNEENSVAGPNYETENETKALNSEIHSGSRTTVSIENLQPFNEDDASRENPPPPNEPVVLLPIPEIKFEEIVIDDDVKDEEGPNQRGRNPHRQKRPSHPLRSSQDSDPEDQTHRKTTRTGSPDPEYGESDSDGDDEDHCYEIPENCNEKACSPSKGKGTIPKLNQVEENRWSYGEHEVTKVKGIFTCPLCKDLKFSKLSDATKHIRKSHLGSIQPNTGPVTCKICKKIFKKQIYLRDHFKRVHSSGQRQVCSTCGMRFKESSKLKLHIRAVHQKEKRHKCEICGKAFFTPFSLKQHMFVHSTERAFECKLCHRRMTQLPGLRRHMKEFHGNQRQESLISPSNATPASATTNTERRRPEVTTETVKNTADIICTKSLTCKLCGRSYQRLFQLSKHVLQIHHIHLKSFNFKSLQRTTRIGDVRTNSDVVTRGVGIMQEELCGSD